jgi:hypothetical protein
MPTDIVGKNGPVGDEPASEVLEMMIIPGGSLVESIRQRRHPEEILKMPTQASLFWASVRASKSYHAEPTSDACRPRQFYERNGLLDVEFKPMICTDQVKVGYRVCLLTDEVGAEVAGFHCHTYGDITLNKKQSQ